jgi:leader peptidase (prepilin peptidase)/N-methyltransferase
MTLISYIFFFILGTVIGSFLNVVIIRLKTKQSILKKPSHCVFCKKKLDWYELIPILSFIIQEGKCRHCKKKISWQYPLVEFFTGLIFVLIFAHFLNFGIITTCFMLLVSCFMIILFVYDLKHYLVPNAIIYPVIVLAFIYRLFGDFNYFIAGLIGGAFFLIIVLISHGKWMGIGDVKIGVLMGLLLGLNYLLVALFLAFFIGAIISIILLILKKKKLKSQIPFAPFLIGATFITLFWGEILINWYLGLVF